MEKIIIGICTHYRNELLKICLDQLNTIQIPNNTQIEVIIMDNTDNSFAQNTVLQKQKNLSYKIHYYSFNGTGIAAVRNKILEKCHPLNPDYIAFLDDDEYPSHNWLINLYTHIKNSEANIIAGPVISKFIDNNLNETKVPNFIKKNPLFNIHTKRKTGKICSSCPTGNVIFDAKILTHTHIKFDENFNKMSGEDLDFFEKLTRAGHKILWCQEAYVIEQIPPERCTLKYLLKRNFNNGYLKIYMKKKNKKFKLKHIINILLNLFLYHIVLPLSFITGTTNGIKYLCLCSFTWGSFYSIFKTKTFNFYNI